jgi:glycosyltransferase involved in cell wall biosynthesis
MKIFVVGRHNSGMIVSGPEKFSYVLFNALAQKYKNNENIVIKYITFYFKELVGSSTYNRLFGYKVYGEDKNVIKVGFIKLFFFLLKEKPDIVHITSGERFTLSIIVSRMIMDFRLITTFHSIIEIELSDAPTNVKVKGLIFEKLALKFSNKIVFVSSLLKDTFKKYYKLKQNYYIIPNGVDAEYNLLEKRNFQIVDNLNLVFYNGFDRIIKRGFDFILENLRMSKFNNISINIVGINVETNEQIPGIKIINHGFLKREELINFWQDKHFFIKSKYFDSFPIMLLEAMACGVIPIISDNVGVSEYIYNKVNGFIYSKNDRFGLLKAINNIYDDGYNLEKISTESSKIKHTLNWDLILEKYFNLYRLQ